MPRKIAKSDPPAEVAAVRAQAGAIVEEQRTFVEKTKLVVEMLVVDTLDAAAYANEVLVGIKRYREKWEQYWRPKINAAHVVHKMLCDDFNELDKPLAKFEDKVKGLLADFIKAKEIRDQKLNAQAARAIVDQKAAAEEEARRLMRSGRVVDAKMLLASIETISVPAPVMEPVKLDGTRQQTVALPYVENFFTLVAAVAQNKAPLEALLVNESWLKRTAAASGKRDGELLFPGVRIKETIRLATSTGSE